MRASPELLLPFSHSHLLFKVTLGPLPAEGLGVDGPSNQFPLDIPGPRGLGDPKDERFAPANPPPMALLNSGLAFGENEEPLGVPGVGLLFPERGDGE